LPCARRNASVWIEQGAVEDWGVKVRVIDYIEKLCAKFQIQMFPDFGLFHHRKIEISQARTIDNVPARIA
jgi:hypothetical protein